MFPSCIKTRSVGQISVGYKAVLEVCNLEKNDLVLGFGCVDFVTNTKIILEVKIWTHSVT